MLNKPLFSLKKKSFHEYTNFLKIVTLIFTFAFTTTIAVQAGHSPIIFSNLHNKHSSINQDGDVSKNIYDVKNLAYYGDWDSNRVFIIDVDNMLLLQIVENTGDGPYGIDQQNASKAYALTRQTESLTVVDNYYMDNIGVIPLSHKPRSTNYNPDTGLSLVSGADKVMTSIINVEHDKVAKVVGYDELSEPHDYGGSLATGHPLWVGDQHFFMLDRAERQIQLWDLKGNLLSVMTVPTSVHHVFQSPLEADKNIFYAVAEGNQQEGISPSVLRYKMMKKRMIKIGEAKLSDYDPENLDPSVMGAHHADFHPDGIHIYIGSTEGHVFVVNKDSMSVVNMIDTGKGSGHTTFAPMRDLAFVTNHNDTFISVIDTVNHQWLKDIEVARSASPDYKSQAHTSSVSVDMNYFYSAASHDGVFFEIDMDTLEISRSIELGGNALMGSFVWDGDSVNM